MVISFPDSGNRMIVGGFPAQLVENGTVTMNFEYVLFDAGGTLLGTNTDSEHWYEQFFVDACAEQGLVVSVGHVHEVLRRAIKSRFFEQRCSSDTQNRDFWQHIYRTAFADLLGARFSHPPAVIEHLAADYMDRFEAGEFIKLFRDTKPALECLRDMGIRMGIVSNFGTYLDKFLEQTGITGFFDFVLISAAEGCEKPNADFFDLALTRCSPVLPGRILFVGDHIEEDYKAAQRHGMQAVLIDRYSRLEGRDLEMKRIRRLTDLADLCRETAVSNN